MHEQAFDLAAVSITRVITSRNLRQARVLVSIRAPAGEQARMLALLGQHRFKFSSASTAISPSSTPPRLEFELDESIAEGDRVLTLIAAMERAQPELLDHPAAGPAAGRRADETSRAIPRLLAPCRTASCWWINPPA